jgi:hypothetical protein
VPEGSARDKIKTMILKKEPVYQVDFF